MTPAEAFHLLAKARELITQGIERMTQEIRGQTPPGTAAALIAQGTAILRRFEAAPFTVACGHGGLLATCTHHRGNRGDV